MPGTLSSGNGVALSSSAIRLPNWDCGGCSQLSAPEKQNQKQKNPKKKQAEIRRP